MWGYLILTLYPYLMEYFGNIHLWNICVCIWFWTQRQFLRTEHEYHLTLHHCITKMKTLKEWIRCAETQTKDRFQNWPEAREMVQQMRAELRKRSKYVFLVLRNDVDPSKPQHQCIMLGRDRLLIWDEYLLSIAKLGWFPDPDCVICFREKRKRDHGKGTETKSKKSRVISLEEIM